MRTLAKAKKARGRPRGRTAPHRPVLSVRVPRELYEKVQVSALASGRTVSEEAVWRTQQSYEWEAAHGTARDMVAEASRITKRAAKANLETVLRERGYTKVQAIEGAVWFEPGVNAPTWVIANDAVLREMLEIAATRALEKAGRQS